MTSSKPGKSTEVGTPLPTSGDEVGTRISLVVGLYKTKTEAARAAGITLEMLNRYIRGDHKLPFEKAAGLCAPVGVSMNWLAWGSGRMMLNDTATAPTEAAPSASHLDEAMMSNVVEGIALLMETEELRFPPSTLSRLTLLLYRLMTERREHLAAAGKPLPPELHEPGHPIRIADDPLFRDIFRLAR